MSRLSLGRALPLAAAALMAAALAGCGKMGELERPQPLFGKAPPPESARAKAAARSSDEQDASRPVRTVDPRDDINNPAPSRTIEIPGQSPDPIAPGPQGSLPDPYSNPR